MRKLVVAASVIALAVAGQALASENARSGALRAGDRLGGSESDSLSQNATWGLILGGAAIVLAAVAISDSGDHNDHGVSG